jgi:hypothetical protein
MMGTHLPELLFILFIVLVGIFGTIFWIWMLVDCAKNEPSENQAKLLWIVVIALTHVLGACLYFLLRRPARLRTVEH